jgi:imidazolonepropionase-like amidohydrolase
MLLPSLACAQDLTPKAPPQTATTVVLDATVHPVSGPPIENASIIFDKGVITDILPHHPHIPSSWQVIDAKGLHAYPGLITPYSQLGLTEIQSVAATNDLRENNPISPETVVANAVNPDSTLLPVTRSNGVLIAGVFPAGGTLGGQPGVIRMDGWTNDDMTITPSLGQTLRWPGMRTVTAWWMDKSEEEQLKEIRERLRTIEETFDAAKAYADARAADPNAPADLRWEAVRPLWDAAGNARLFIHAQDLDQINAAVQFCARRGLRCTLIGGRDAPLAAELLKEHAVPVIILGTHAMPRRDDAPYDDAFSLPARLAQAGITFSIATGDDTAHERNLPYAAAMAAAHGLSADDALRALTLDSAKVLGIEKQYGSLEKGKSATLILTTGNPLEITTQVRRAFIDGREIDLSNKQSKLAEKYLEKARQRGDIPRPPAPNPLLDAQPQPR